MPLPVSNPILIEFQGSKPDETDPNPLSSEICGPVRESKNGNGQIPRPTAYLMVAEIDVFNHRDPENARCVPVFFDTESQPSFITMDLAVALAPPRVAKEEMQVGVFMSKSVRLVSPRYSVLLKRMDGGWEPVTLNQTPNIIPPV